jgi:hypothetical protein
MKLSYSCTAALAAVAVTACASGDGEWRGSVSDSAGITLVANTDDGIWTASEQWRVEEDLRIGSAEGDADYQFGQIGARGIAVGSDGRIYVLDAQAQHVRVFSPEGVYQSTIGRPGGGPGEIGAGANFLMMGPADTLVVVDLGNQRINRYLPDGAAAGSFLLSIEQQGLPLNFASTSSGVLARQSRPLALPGRPAADSLDAVVAFTCDGSVTDTLIKFPSGGTLSLGGGTPELNLFAAEPVWDLAAGRQVLYGMNDDYWIGLYAAGGRLTRVITKPFETTPVGERDQQAVMGFLERAWTDAGVPPQALAQLRGIVHFGESYPAFARIAAGPGESVWVQHFQSVSALSDDEYESYNPLEDTGAPDWDVFDADGRFLGIVTMPTRFQPRHFVGNSIYGVWRDELDVQHVMRLRVIGV